MLISQIKHFFIMGGYASYVWPAYIICLIVLMGNSFWTRIMKRQLWRKLIGRQQRWEK